jgi:hypothetical protein
LGSKRSTTELHPQLTAPYVYGSDLDRTRAVGRMVSRIIAARYGAVKRYAPARCRT